MWALKCASFNYNFTMKRIPSSLNICTRKRKRCHVYLLMPYNWPSNSNNNEVTIMNHYYYWFDGLWNVKAKYIVLCWNALTKWQNPKGASGQTALMGNCSTGSHMPWPYQSTKLFVIILLQVVFRAWDSVVTRECLLRRKLTWNVSRQTYSKI